VVQRYIRPGVVLASGRSQHDPLTALSVVAQRIRRNQYVHQIRSNPLFLAKNTDDRTRLLQYLMQRQFFLQQADKVHGKVLKTCKYQMLINGREKHMRQRIRVGIIHVVVFVFNLHFFSRALINAALCCYCVPSTYFVCDMIHSVFCFFVAT